MPLVLLRSQQQKEKSLTALDLIRTEDRWLSFFVDLRDLRDFVVK